MLHPCVLCAILITALNDHWLKLAMPGAVTGKLSDVFGLAFFPALLGSAWELVVTQVHPRYRLSRAALLSCTCATVLVFAAIKTSPWASTVYDSIVTALRQALPFPLSSHRAQNTVDPSDLLALPAAFLPLCLGRARPKKALRGQRLRHLETTSPHLDHARSRALVAGQHTEDSEHAA